MNEPADKERSESCGGTAPPRKLRYLFQFIASAAAFYGIRFLFGREWIANPYLGYLLTVAAGTCLYLMLDSLVSGWYADSRKISRSRRFRFGMVLVVLPVVTFEMMILLFLAGYFCNMAGLASLSNFFFYGLFPTIPSLATDTMASEIHFTIRITLLPAVPGFAIMVFEYYKSTKD